MNADQCACVRGAVDGPGTGPDGRARRRRVAVAATPSPAPSADGRKLLTQLEAALQLRLDELGVRDPCRVIRRMAGRGQLRGVRVGRNLLIDPKSIDAYVAGGGK